MTARLALKKITKHYPSVVANDCVDLVVRPGEIHAVLGESGAGKSTLMKIFSGVYTEYEGEINYKGQTVKFKSTREAEEAGIAIIHQELNLVPHLSIAENIFSWQGTD